MLLQLPALYSLQNRQLLLQGLALCGRLLPRRKHRLRARQLC